MSPHHFSCALIVVWIALLLELPAAASADPDALSGTLKTIKETGRIRLGHREASYPFAYRDKHGQPVGYTMDLCYKIVELVRQELDLPALAVELVPVTIQTAFPMLINGEIDIECGSTTQTLSRSKVVDFLHVIFVNSTKIAVKKGNGIKEVEDLSGKRLALMRGSSNEERVKKIVRDEGLRIDYHIIGIGRRLTASPLPHHQT